MNVPWAQPPDTAVTWNCPDDAVLPPLNYVPDCSGSEWSIDDADPWQRPFAETATDTVTLSATATFGQQMDFDVTADVMRILDGANGAGWLIRHEAGGGTIEIASNENAYGLAVPELVLEYEADSFVPTACPAPDLDDSRITRVAEVVSHVYSGACPVQRGTGDTVLQPDQVAHLRGNVINGSGAPLSGVHVRVLGHSDFGWTRTRSGVGDAGEWDLVVNGGGRLVVEFSKDRYLTVQRSVEVIRNDYVVLDDVVLLEQQDEIDCMQVPDEAGGFYVGPDETDGRGTRRLAMYFPSGPALKIESAGGQVKDYCVCSVEYTVDRTSSATGPRAMPGALPATSGYTYAADLQLRPYDPMAGTCADAPIVSPRFKNSPIFAYVLDYDFTSAQTFLGFGVGSNVPSGHYDQQAAAWVAEPDGRVVEIVDDGSGGCAFDVTGDGIADTNIDGNTAHNVTAAELSALAGHCGSGLEYTIGDRLWRIPVYHFSDWNWALGFLGGALAPFLQWMGDGMVNGGCHVGGSIIGCEDQTLGEAVPIAGTPWALHYQSERQRGRRSRYELDIPFRGRVLESGTACTDDGDCGAGEVCGADGQCATEPAEVHVEIQVAGNRYVYGPLAYSTGSFQFDAWDGTDAWGRLLQGAVPVTVRLGFFFDAEYVDPEEVYGRSFSMPPDSTATPDVPAGRIGFWTTWRGLIGGWDQGSIEGRARGQGLGGWSLTPHHVYDARAGILYRGDGSQLATRGLQPLISTFAGGGTGGEGSPANQASLPTPAAAAMAPDGTVYVVQAGTGGADNRLRQVTPGGVLRPFAGNGTYGDAADDVAAATAAFRFGQTDPRSGIVVRRSGAVVVVDGRNNTLREVRDGRVRRIAGQQRYNAVETCPADAGGLGDGGDAADALIRCPLDVAEGPDGALYITETGNDRIRRVDAAGVITTFATITNPGGIAVSERGDVYVTSNDNSVWRISPDRSERRIAGGGGACTGSEGDPPGDGDFAWLGCLVGARDIAIGRDGSLYILEKATERVRRVTPEGVIETVVGRGDTICETCTPRRLRGDGGAATSAHLFTPSALVYGHDGAVYVVDVGDQRIRRVNAALPDAVVGESVVAEPDGSLVYRFDDQGRHVATQHGLTGEQLLEIDYWGGSGLVTHITASSGGPDLAITRNPSTLLPTELASGFGQRSFPGYDAIGNMSYLEDPESRTHEMTYYEGSTEEGLLKYFTVPDGKSWLFTHDNGRLTSDMSPTIEQTLTRRECGDTGYACDTEVSSGWGVVHSFTGASWQSRALDVWQIGDTVLRRRVTEPTGARTVWELGNLDGTLTAPTATSTESVAISHLTQAADGSVISVATGADPRPGLGEYVRAARMVRPTAVTTNVAMLRETIPANPTDWASITDLNHTITVNDTRTTTLDVHLDDTMPSCWEETTITSPTSLVTTVCADQYGRVRSINAPGLEPIAFQYNATTGGVSSVTQGVRQAQVSYAAPGGGTQPWVRSISAMDAPGGTAVDTVTYTRDGAGWIDQADHTSSTTSSTLGLGRDLRGRITSLTLPHSQVHSHSYTDGYALSRYTPPTVTSTSPGGVLDIPLFDAAERPEALRVMNGMTIVESLDYVYHATYGYLQRIDLPASRSIVITRNATTTPDTVSVDGRIASLVLDGATTSYTYDGVFLDTEAWSGTVAGSVARDIDAYGEFTQLWINSTALTYDHDDEGRLTQAGSLVVTPTLETTPTVHWERATSLTGTTLTSSEVFNRYGELDDLEVSFSTPGDLYTYSVGTRDEVGRETARSEHLTGESARAYTFFYDGENRLEEVRVSGAAVATYGYDANGNRTSVGYAGAWASLPDVAHTTYDAQDRLTQYGNTSLGDEIQCTYTYRASGHVATRNCGSGTETFDYDIMGNLLSVSLPSGLTIDYDVDALGRRIRRRVMSGMTVLEEQRWLYLDGLNPVAELDASNAITRIFVYGTRANVPDYMIQGSSVYRFIVDPRGSLRAVVDSTGTVRQRMEYDAFGNTVSEYLAVGFDPVPFGFAGGIYDPLTELVRFGARDYDALTGRWTAKDPLLFEGGDTNLYVYASNDPVTFVDPLGTWVVIAGGVIGGGAAAYAHYGSYASGRISGTTYAGIIAFGAITGMLGMAAPGIGGSVVAGMVGGFANNAFGQWMTAADCSQINWVQASVAGILGAGSGFLSGVGIAAGSNIATLGPTFARLSGNYVSQGARATFTNYGNLGGALGGATGEVLAVPVGNWILENLPPPRR